DAAPAPGDPAALHLTRRAGHGLARRPGGARHPGRPRRGRRPPPGPGRGPRRGHRPGQRLRRVPAPGGLARAGGAGEAGVVRRPALLGTADRGLGRRRAVPAHRGSRPGGQRRQPDRPHLHRRPQRRLALREPAPHRVGDAADQRARRRRPAPRGRPDGRDRAVRPAGEQADRRRAGHLRPLDRLGDHPAPAVAAGRRRARRVRLGGGPPVAGGRGPDHDGAPAEVRPRGGGGPDGRGGTRAHPARLLPPLAAQHLHRTAHAGDDRRGVHPGRRAVRKDVRV
ncbi:MAG: Uracil-DNA glycosylase, family 5, partial [uncultured Nocardioides sp.]